MAAGQRWTYAAPLRAVDEVLDCGEGYIVTRKTVSGREPYLAGHFPGFPVYPGTFVLETVHQSVLYYAEHRLREQAIPDLVAIHRARYFTPIRPGDTLEVECRCQTAPGGILDVDATCTTGRGKAAAIRLAYRLGGSR